MLLPSLRLTRTLVVCLLVLSVLLGSSYRVAVVAAGAATARSEQVGGAEFDLASSKQTMSLGIWGVIPSLSWITTTQIVGSLFIIAIVHTLFKETMVALLSAIRLWYLILGYLVSVTALTCYETTKSGMDWSWSILLGQLQPTLWTAATGMLILVATQVLRYIGAEPEEGGKRTLTALGTMKKVSQSVFSLHLYALLGKFLPGPLDHRRTTKEEEVSKDSHQASKRTTGAKSSSITTSTCECDGDVGDFELPSNIQDLLSSLYEVRSRLKIEEAPHVPLKKKKERPAKKEKERKRTQEMEEKEEKEKKDHRGGDLTEERRIRPLALPRIIGWDEYKKDLIGKIFTGTGSKDHIYNAYAFMNGDYIKALNKVLKDHKWESNRALQEIEVAQIQNELISSSKSDVERELWNEVFNDLFKISIQYRTWDGIIDFIGLDMIQFTVHFNSRMESLKQQYYQSQSESRSQPPPSGQSETVMTEIDHVRVLPTFRYLHVFDLAPFVLSRKCKTDPHSREYRDLSELQTETDNKYLRLFNNLMVSLFQNNFNQVLPIKIILSIKWELQKELWVKNGFGYCFLECIFNEYLSDATADFTYAHFMFFMNKSLETNMSKLRKLWVQDKVKTEEPKKPAPLSPAPPSPASPSPPPPSPPPSTHHTEKELKRRYAPRSLSQLLSNIQVYDRKVLGSLVEPVVTGGNPKAVEDICSFDNKKVLTRFLQIVQGYQWKSNQVQMNEIFDIQKQVNEIFNIKRGVGPVILDALIMKYVAISEDTEDYTTETFISTMKCLFEAIAKELAPYTYVTVALPSKNDLSSNPSGVVGTSLDTTKSILSPSNISLSVQSGISDEELGKIDENTFIQHVWGTLEAPLPYNESHFMLLMKFVLRKYSSSDSFVEDLERFLTLTESSFISQLRQKGLVDDEDLKQQEDKIRQVLNDMLIGLGSKEGCFTQFFLPSLFAHAEKMASVAFFKSFILGVLKKWKAIIIELIKQECKKSSMSDSVPQNNPFQGLLSRLEPPLEGFTESSTSPSIDSSPKSDEIWNVKNINIKQLIEDTIAGKNIQDYETLLDFATGGKNHMESLNDIFSQNSWADSQVLSKEEILSVERDLEKKLKKGTLEYKLWSWIFGCFYKTASWKLEGANIYTDVGLFKGHINESGFFIDDHFNASITQKRSGVLCITSAPIAQVETTLKIGADALTLEGLVRLVKTILRDRTTHEKDSDDLDLILKDIDKPESQEDVILSKSIIPIIETAVGPILGWTPECELSIEQVLSVKWSVQKVFYVRNGFGYYFLEYLFHQYFSRQGVTSCTLKDFKEFINTNFKAEVLKLKTGVTE